MKFSGACCARSLALALLVCGSLLLLLVATLSNPAAQNALLQQLSALPLPMTSALVSMGILNVRHGT